MYRLLAFVILGITAASTSFACSCAVPDAQQLRKLPGRIALVEVIELGTEFDGQYPSFPGKAARNRKVRVRTIEAFKGTWPPEETIEETISISGYEFECSL